MCQYEGTKGEMGREESCTLHRFFSKTCDFYQFGRIFLIVILMSVAGCVCGQLDATES